MVNKYQEEKRFPYSKRQLFELVMDIEKYPEFLPWAKAARIIERHDNYLIADLLVNFKGVEEQYRSHVSFRKYAFIEVKQVDGPFKILHNKWEFLPSAEGGAKLAFSIEFEFRSFILRNLMGGMFKKAQHKMIEAFEKRADELYKHTLIS